MLPEDIQECAHDGAFPGATGSEAFGGPSRTAGSLLPTPRVTSSVARDPPALPGRPGPVNVRETAGFCIY
jgi:hypothetical protein